MYLRDTKLLLTEHKGFGPRLSQYGPGRCVQKKNTSGGQSVRLG